MPSSTRKIIFDFKDSHFYENQFYRQLFNYKIPSISKLFTELEKNMAYIVALRLELDRETWKNFLNLNSRSKNFERQCDEFIDQLQSFYETFQTSGIILTTQQKKDIMNVWENLKSLLINLLLDVKKMLHTIYPKFTQKSRFSSPLKRTPRYKSRYSKYPRYPRSSNPPKSPRSPKSKKRGRYLSDSVSNSDKILMRKFIPQNMKHRIPWGKLLYINFEYVFTSEEQIGFYKPVHVSESIDEALDVHNSLPDEDSYDRYFTEHFIRYITFDTFYDKKRTEIVKKDYITQQEKQYLRKYDDNSLITKDGIDIQRLEWANTCWRDWREIEDYSIIITPKEVLELYKTS